MILKLGTPRAMRSNYDLSLTQRQSLDFQDEMKKNCP